MELIHGIGMYMMTDFMHMRSRRSVILFGGIGVMVLTAMAGIMVGDGIVLTMAGVIIRVLGTVATGEAGTVAVAIGDIIITIILTMVGVVAEDIIPTVV